MVGHCAGPLGGSRRMRSAARSSMNSLTCSAVTRPAPACDQESIGGLQRPVGGYEDLFPALDPVKQGFGPGRGFVLEAPRERGGGVGHETGHQYLWPL